MKIRAVHMRGQETGIRDINLEFRDEKRRIFPSILLVGENGSGKTFLFSALARAWQCCMREQSRTDTPYIADMLRFDFEVESKIAGLYIRKGVVERSSTLASFAEISSGDNPGIKNGIVYYSSDRSAISRSSLQSGSDLPESTCSVFPVIYDLHQRNISQSVILIDDWDRGLDPKSAKQFYLHLSRHALSKDNQLVLSSCSYPMDDYFPVEGIFKLEGRADPVGSSMGLFSRLHSSLRGKKE